jgi:DNA repair photolyase
LRQALLVNAPEVLLAELRRPSWRREHVSVGTIVDPYQPVEGRYRITRGMLRALAATRTPATIITKNSLVRRDVDVLRELHARAGCAVFVSVTSLDAELLRRMEPGTPPPLRRLETIRRLVDAGIPAGVAAMPVLPGITDGQDSLAALAAAAQAHGAAFFMVGALRLGPGIEPWFYPFLRSERPDLLPLYQRLYPTGYVPNTYVERLRARAEALRLDFALPAGPPPLLPAQEPAQLAFNW